MAKLHADIKVDTGYIGSLSSEIKLVVTDLQAAIQEANKANRHTRWRGAGVGTVTTAIGLINKEISKTILTLEGLASALQTGAGDFEAVESDALANMGTAELRGIG